MVDSRDTPHKNFTAALEAIGNLLIPELNEFLSSGERAALVTSAEIEIAPIYRKTGIFYRHFLPLRMHLISLLADSYRRYFKLALAHPRHAGSDSDKWACSQLQPAIDATLEWIRDWYILASDGTNQRVQPIGTIEYRAGETVSLPVSLTPPPSPTPESWRAPAWLFQVSIALVGVGPLKTKHVPETDSEQKLSAAHTRLLLKGARRVFLWELEAAIKRVRNEETAAAGATPALMLGGGQAREPKKSKYWLKGVEGLQRKADLSRYMQGLTDKQQMAASLNWEYGLGLTEIASRMGIDRKTADEHIKAAERKINQARSSEKRKAHRTKSNPES
jgi:DNA-binding CsgD family transcriptional regulator